MHRHQLGRGLAYEHDPTHPRSAVALPHRVQPAASRFHAHLLRHNRTRRHRQPHWRPRSDLALRRPPPPPARSGSTRSVARIRPRVHQHTIQWARPTRAAPLCSPHPRPHPLPPVASWLTSASPRGHTQPAPATDRLIALDLGHSLADRKRRTAPPARDHPHAPTVCAEQRHHAITGELRHLRRRSARPPTRSDSEVRREEAPPHPRHPVDSERLVNPARSANSTDTTRRSRRSTGDTASS